jgi:uncharacterized membrane protein
VFLEMATKTTKKITKKAPVKKVPHLYKERNPDCHKMTGKFVGLYVMFALTTIAFAAIAVWLFFFSSDILAKYEKVVKNNGNGNNCQVVEEETEE